MPQSEDESELEHESSEEEEISEDVARPQMQNGTFLACLDDATQNVIKHTHRNPVFVVPQMKISRTTRIEPTAYLAPNIFVWDPVNFGVRVKCKGGDHKMHKNDWRDTLAYDFSGPVFLRRRMMKCQKVVPTPKHFPRFQPFLQVGCSNVGKSYVVRDEGISAYPFYHTDKRVFTKTLYDYIINSVTQGQTFRNLVNVIEEGQRLEYVRRKSDWQEGFRATYTPAEAQMRLFGQEVPYPAFPTFEVTLPHETYQHHACHITAIQVRSLPKFVEGGGGTQTTAVPSVVAFRSVSQPRERQCR